MSILIISGISGSGKTLTCNALEDIGYYCIDNLPPQLLLPVCGLQKDNPSIDNLAIVIDARSQNMFESFAKELTNLRQQNVEYKLLFIYADSEIILNRYKQTRRRHPLLSDVLPTLEQAIDKEYQLCDPIMQKADYVVDTTNMAAMQLKQYIVDMFKQSSFNGLTLKLESFGYRNGLPNEADLVFDVRCLPNPFYIESLKTLNGQDQEVYDYVFSFEESKHMAEMIVDFLRYTLPLYEKEGKSELVVAIGCTSGHHRSGSMVRCLKKALSNDNYQIVVIDRDIDKAF